LELSQTHTEDVTNTHNPTTPAFLSLLGLHTSLTNKKQIGTSKKKWTSFTNKTEIGTSKILGENRNNLTNAEQGGEERPLSNHPKTPSQRRRLRRYLQYDCSALSNHKSPRVADTSFLNDTKKHHPTCNLNPYIHQPIRLQLPNHLTPTTTH
jgi:hypothetical protein